MKEKQHDKSMVMSPTVRDEKRQQQLRDREMREAHIEKQMCSAAAAKSKDLRVGEICDFSLVMPSTSTAPLAAFSSIGQTNANLIATSTAAGAGGGGGGGAGSLGTTPNASPLLASNRQQFHPAAAAAAAAVAGQPPPTAAFVHHGKQQFFVERDRESRDRFLNGQVGKAKVAAAELRAAQANN
ncbi:unnamed protein product, partial [Gongylonema pulchrum]|uniref:Uncharacterized protein n=1 Tax=Gongylonema pulchrum TaxID=637853 RepID=A0A183EQ16_9BILA